MSDFMVASSSPYNTTEHYHKRVLTGDAESVRLRLVNALERLGYDILDDEENVIRGRRGARGWASAWASADVLEYPMTLIVKLKPHGPHATRATFDYVVKHPALSRGEKAILTREAEAVSSLAMVRAAEKICPACGTEATDDSRFCRKCGSAMIMHSSDLEVLRMAAEVRAGYTSVVATAITLTATTLLMGITLLVMFLTGVVFMEGLAPLLIIGLAASVINIFFAFFGWNRLSRALSPKPREEPAFQDIRMPELPAAGEAFAADRQIPASVTEGTTNLLNADQASRITGSFDDSTG
ncbi:MAG: zinc ribbon domain-containing protein [Acidobacteriota bacterium]